MRAAIIDIGSNSVRLLLLEGDSRTKRKQTTRLGEGTLQRRLLPAAVSRTVEAVDLFARLGRERELPVMAFATSAVRDAENRRELLDAIEARCGVRVEVLSGKEEAHLSYLGASGGARCGVIDIGGGSTELVEGEAGTVRRAVSLQLGAVRLRSQCGQDLAAARAQIARQMAGFCATRGLPWRGVGGTLTALAAIEQKLDPYEESCVDGYTLSTAGVQALTKRLWEMDIPARRNLPGLESGRADIIAHGALILEGFLLAQELEQVAVSTSDNLEGYARWKGAGGEE